MEFHLTTSHVPFPMGLEKETAQLAQNIFQNYKDFFIWVQEGKAQSIELDETEKTEILSRLAQIKLPLEAADESSGGEAAAVERWLLDQHDIEYFYGLARPADIGCACPYGWVEKVNRIIDQQYPIFGAERFPRLEEKASHVVWLLFKNEVFPDVLEGIGALAMLALLGRNGIEVRPRVEDLKEYFAVQHFLLEQVEAEEKDEDQAIYLLGQFLQSWEKQ